MKQGFRIKLLTKRQNLSFAWKKWADSKIRAKLFRFSLFQKAKKIFCYVSKPDEVDTLEIIHYIFQHAKQDEIIVSRLKKRVVVPKVKGKKLDLFEIHHFDHLEQGTFGIFEPQKHRPKIRPEDIDLAIIPGIAFDKYGHRIGYGHGYFDRFLKKLTCHKIGLAYGFQVIEKNSALGGVLIEKIPTHPYDVPVDFVITEKRVFKARLKANSSNVSKSSTTR